MNYNKIFCSNESVINKFYFDKINSKINHNIDNKIYDVKPKEKGMEKNNLLNTSGFEQREKTNHSKDNMKTSNANNNNGNKTINNNKINNNDNNSITKIIEKPLNTKTYAELMKYKRNNLYKINEEDDKSSIVSSVGPSLITFKLS